MNSSPISFLTKIYNNSHRCNIIRHNIAYDELYHISVTLKLLRNSLGSEAEEEYWRQILGPIRRFIFALCSIPLPPVTIATAFGIDWDKLNHRVRLCQQLYPDFHASLAELVQKLRNLTGDSSFLAPLESLCIDDTRVSAVINISRMNKYVEKYFNEITTLQKIEIVSARQLREFHICDRLVTFGPCKWAPEHIFLSPHAHEIHVINFDWLQDQWKPSSVFASNSQSVKNRSVSHCLGRLPGIINKSEQAFRSEDLPSLNSLDLLPPTPTFRKEMLHDAGWEPSRNEELTPARFCHLAGERAVFVSADDNAAQFVIDLSSPSKPIKRVPAGELEPDMYLLLRTAGGGDFLIPLANRILGRIANERRKQQTEWKSQLISTAKKQFGELNRGALASAVSNYLSSNGLLQASPANVFYWMSARSIRPSKKEAFIAILEYSGIQNKSEELWEAMEEIDRAHRRAGHTIRKMLLYRISTTSLEPLKRDGEMVFDLGEQDGGSISAFQIINISEDEFDIPINLIGSLLDFGV